VCVCVCFSLCLSLTLSHSRSLSHSLTLSLSLSLSFSLARLLCGEVVLLWQIHCTEGLGLTSLLVRMSDELIVTRYSRSCLVLLLRRPSCVGAKPTMVAVMLSIEPAYAMKVSERQRENNMRHLHTQHTHTHTHMQTPTSRQLLSICSQMSRRPRPASMRERMKSTTAWLLMTSQMPSLARTINSVLSSMACVTTSGSAITACSSALKSCGGRNEKSASCGSVCQDHDCTLLDLRSKSPKARDMASIPLTRSQVTRAPAFSILSFSSAHDHSHA
jgi:hypothetical protein